MEGMKMKTAQAGTLESMDCLVTASAAERGKGIFITMEGANIARFRDSILKTAKATLLELGIKDVVLSIQFNGANDVVLKARVEAAARTLMGGEE
jgi:citrate lyase subunit gamma (acyl carrier protein)